MAGLLLVALLTQADATDVGEVLPHLRGTSAREPEEVEDAQVGRGARALSALLFSVAGAATPIGVALLASNRLEVLALSEVYVAPVLIAGLALLGHRVAKGRGHFGWAMFGAMLGIGAGMLALGVDTHFTGTLPQVSPAAAVIGEVLSLALPIVMLELGDARARIAEDDGGN
jgi:hypothetical protein